MSESNTPAFKQCYECGNLRLRTEFYRHPGMADGRLNICKSCQRARSKARYDRKAKDPVWRDSERRRTREKHHRLYSGKPKVKDGRYRARNAVRNAVRDRRIAPASRCEGCGHDFSEFRRECHHTDYSKPLAVIWLCSRCHHRQHSLA